MPFTTGALSNSSMTISRVARAASISACVSATMISMTNDVKDVDGSSAIAFEHVRLS